MSNSNEVIIPKIYRVKFEADVSKKSVIKHCNVHIDIEVNGGEFVPENFERFIVGQKVASNWTVLSAKYISKKLKQINHE